MMISHPSIKYQYHNALHQYIHDSLRLRDFCFNFGIVVRQQDQPCIHTQNTLLNYRHQSYVPYIYAVVLNTFLYCNHKHYHNHNHTFKLIEYN